MGRDRSDVGGGPVRAAIRHPLAGAAELTGRVVTVLDPSGYVLVDGLLVRAEPAVAGPEVAGPEVGDQVELSLDGVGQTLTARAVAPAPVSAAGRPLPRAEQARDDLGRSAADSDRPSFGAGTDQRRPRWPGRILGRGRER